VGLHLLGGRRHRGDDPGLARRVGRRPAVGAKRHARADRDDTAAAAPHHARDEPREDHRQGAEVERDLAVPGLEVEPVEGVAVVEPADQVHQSPGLSLAVEIRRHGVDLPRVRHVDPAQVHAIPVALRGGVALAVDDPRDDRTHAGVEQR
jgi:hypothetical protein